MKTGIEDYVVVKDNKVMAMGYTTGTCATAAAAAAAETLLSGKAPEAVTVHTPKGIVLHLPIQLAEGGQAPVCGVQKYSGDDPDVTDGIWIYARAEICDGEEILLDGGLGVGRVTKPGLEQPVGAAAINRVPRRMIREAVQEVRERFCFPKGLKITIIIPEGEALAAKTFNPRLGIVGGLSVLGTSGIVEPMSEASLIASIEVELSMKAAAGEKNLLLSPGNYGQAYMREHLSLDLELAVKCSNFIGATIDSAVRLGFERLLLIGHIGKLVKMAAGIMNTHSREADGRMEILAAHAALCGADGDTVRAVLACLVTDDALRLLSERGLLDATMKSLTKKIEFYLKKRSYDKLTVGVVLFSNEWGELARNAEADDMLRTWRTQEQGD